ncbi:MAG: zinc ABC transporter substrate-binding protein [Bacilli bacterium]|nr:zinc ABC transporter substrate-binding protein [Bacilli bacterium]
MKKIKILVMTIILISLTGCFNNDSMEDITISTSVYPIEYVVNSLYGEHSTINSIYPSDSEIIDFEITDVLLEQYSDSDLFIFNGLSDEKNYIEPMRKNNQDLKIIDVASNMKLENSIEELWLDPNKLLTIANNIKTGFEEYIDNTYLINEIEANYETLKIELTKLDGNYYSAAKMASNKTIIVSDDAFLFLEKYGIEIISLDEDTVTDKNIADAKKLINNGDCNYIYIKYGKEKNDTISKVVDGTNVESVELYTMTNLYEVDTEKTNYITLMNQNLENLKLELYK